MERRTEGRAPRTPTGGYSARYEARREARGATRAYGPRWNDSTATRLYAALQEDSAEQGVALEANTEAVLRDARRGAALVARAGRKRGMSASDQRIALAQLEHAGGSLAAAGMDEEAQYKAVRAFLGPMRSRSRAQRKRLVSRPV